MFKFMRRVSGVVVLTILSFRAVGSFLSWVERQEDGPQSVWTDEDEFEDAWKLFSLHAPKGIRALVFFPLVLATIGWYQTRRKFCLAFGLSGVFNFGNLGEVFRVQDPVQRSADRAQALKMLAKATLVAAMLALILTVFPA